MPRYSQLLHLLQGAGAGGSAPDYETDVIPYLVDVWLDEYVAAGGSDLDVVQVSTGGFEYLFDVAAERLLAAWGVSQGKHTGARPASRMAGHPLGAGAGYHRGHAVPHTLGGGTDINLVPQLGSVNVGAFRPLEIQAVGTPGALYFTHWSYADATSQKPAAVEQGLIRPGLPPDIRTHAN